MISSKFKYKTFQKLCVVSHCVFLKITCTYEGGSRFCQVSITDLRPALPWECVLY